MSVGNGTDDVKLVDLTVMIGLWPPYLGFGTEPGVTHFDTGDEADRC